MTVGGASRLENIRHKHMELFSQEVGLGRNVVLTELNKMGNTILPAAEKVRDEIVKQYGKAPILDQVMRVITKSCNHFKNKKLIQ